MRSEKFFGKLFAVFIGMLIMFTAPVTNAEPVDKIIVACTAAISSNPNNAEAYCKRGDAYNSKGEYDKAIADFTRAIELNPINYEAYNNRGFTYYNQGEYDKAIEDYNKAIAINPGDDRAQNNLNMALEAKEATK